MSVDWPYPPPRWCCSGGAGVECVCPPMERALRAWSSGAMMPPMSKEERERCLEEIGRVEGWDRGEHEADTDAELARNVLSAWTDYCRDQGMIP